jgi:N-acetylmuramoyl-L-alanine amidase
VLHADASNTVASSLDWCRRAESQVSYHVLIGRRGDVYALVRPERKAWHAGRSEWDGQRDCNTFTIGVCLSNRNDGEAYPDAQLDAAVAVCKALCEHFAIPPRRITTHAKIAIPAGRKTDPKGLDVDAFIRRVEAP